MWYNKNSIYFSFKKGDNVTNINSEISPNTIEQFAIWLKDQGKAESTIKTYVTVLEKFQAWLKTMEKELSQINNSDVQIYMNHLEEQQKNAGTIEKYLAGISVFSRYSGNTQIVLNIDRKQKPKEIEVPESLNDEQIKKLLFEIESSRNLRNVAIVYMLLHTGLRISELCALNNDDIVMSDDGKGKLLVRNNGEIDRTIPLSREVKAHLLQYLDSLNGHEDALFVSSINRRISPRAVQYMLEKYNVNPHKLRHTFCRQLINKGIDINTVAKLAGHRDVNVTKRYVSDIEINFEDAIDQAF